MGIEQYGPERFSDVIRDSTGKGWVASNLDDCGVTVYDSAGTFIQPIG